MPPSHLAAMTDIEQCRTEALGGQVYQCPECGEKRYSYHSCQNRHCPKCQNAAGQEWLEQQQALLLPVPYFLLTFTLPEELREVARSHQKLVYGLLFRASAAAAQQLAQDPRFVGGTLSLSRQDQSTRSSFGLAHFPDQWSYMQLAHKSRSDSIAQN